MIKKKKKIYDMYFISCVLTDGMDILVNGEHGELQSTAVAVGGLLEFTHQNAKPVVELLGQQVPRGLWKQAEKKGDL